MYLIGHGRYAREGYPSTGGRNGILVPNEIIRYGFGITTGMAGTSINPIANQLGATPQDVSSPTNLAALFFTVPGGQLDLGDLVVINGGSNTGDPIDVQYTIATIANPSVTPDGSLKVGVIDPAAGAGVFSSQIDFRDVLIPAGGGILNVQFIIPGNVTVTTALLVSLSVGVLWDPATITNPPA